MIESNREFSLDFRLGVPVFARSYIRKIRTGEIGIPISVDPSNVEPTRKHPIISHDIVSFTGSNPEGHQSLSDIELSNAPDQPGAVFFNDNLKQWLEGDDQSIADQGTDQ